MEISVYSVSTLAGPLSLFFSRFPFARSTAAKLVRRGCRRRRRRAKREIKRSERI